MNECVDCQREKNRGMTSGRLSRVGDGSVGSRLRHRLDLLLVGVLESKNQSVPEMGYEG